MCKWSRFKVGDKVLFAINTEAICNSCGGPSCEEGGMALCVYLGHRQIRRYGLCDVFEYVYHHACMTCGENNDMWLDPCGGLYSGLFEESEVEELVELPCNRKTWGV